MKIAIVGAGAMGSLFGGLLATTDSAVWLVDPIATGHIRTVNDAGLVIESDGDERHVSPHATTRIEDVGTADLVVLFVKAPFTDEALRGALPAIEADRTWVLSLQNGAGLREVMRNHVDPDRLLRGTTAHGATFLEPGRIRHAGAGPTRVGSVASLADEAPITAILDVFRQANIESERVEDIDQLIWHKLLVNVGINALTALFRVKNGKLLEEPDLRETMRGAVREGVAVAKACGLDFDEALAIERVEGVCQQTAANKSSMRQDVEAGAPTEIAFINGTIVDRGMQRNVAVPLNRLLTRLIGDLA
ncbi:MAG: ketopantoate reductase family protein [Candidatus Bipolaricaulia bacterium]